MVKDVRREKTKEMTVKRNKVKNERTGKTKEDDKKKERNKKKKEEDQREKS